MKTLFKMTSTFPGNMRSLDEIEALLNDDDSRSRAGHFIQVRREEAGQLRLVAVPAFPVGFSPAIVSFALFLDANGKPQLVRSINHLFAGAFGIVIVLLVLFAAIGDSTDRRELSWLGVVVVCYVVLKGIGIKALDNYVRELRVRLSRVDDGSHN